MHRYLKLGLLAGGVVGTSFAQSPDPFAGAAKAVGEATKPALEAAKPATQAAGTPAQAAPGAGGGGQSVNINSLESGTLLSVINKAFDTNADSVNPEEGTFTWKGHNYNIGQARIFRARFERYLSLPITPDEKAYREIVDQIFDLLSTRNAAGAQDNIMKAWQLLYQASEFELDGGNSLGIANQVFNAWRIRDEKQALNITQTELQRLRKQQVGGVTYGGDVLAAESGRTTVDAVTATAGALPSPTGSASGTANGTTANAGTAAGNNAGGNNRGGARTGGTAPNTRNANESTVGPASQMMRVRELAETEAKIKALEASGLLTVTQAKLQFQTQLVSLFLQRRFQHCMIASSFYRYIFKGSHQNMEVGKKELAEFLPSSDMAFTVETLEFLSREAINDVNNGMASVRASYDDGNRITALERLQETFFLGEFLPAVSQFERAKKQELFALYRKVDEARKLTELRDFEAVAKLSEEIGTITKDFPGSRTSAAVRSVQSMSTLTLNAAQKAAALGDYNRAQELVQKAAEIWPLNPAIAAYTRNMASQADMGTQAAGAFDEAFKRNEFRRIFDKRSELAVAFLSDPVRGAQLKDVIEKMSRVELYLAQAQELLAQNNAHSAWEALASATPLAPDDVELNQRKAALAPRVAEFVGQLDKAQRFENEGRYAASLTNYLAAQDAHPVSTLARQGLERVTAKMLDQMSAEAAARSTTVK